jgi:hypothetical protein
MDIPGAWYFHLGSWRLTLSLLSRLASFMCGICAVQLKRRPLKVEDSSLAKHVLVVQVLSEILFRMKTFWTSSFLNNTIVALEIVMRWFLLWVAATLDSLASVATPPRCLKLIA